MFKRLCHLVRQFIADESGELGTIALLIGTIVSGVGAISSGIAAKRQADTQAAIFEQQALRAKQEAAVSAEDFARRQSRLAAARRAAIGGAGVQLASGSPLLVSEDIAAETELGRRRIEDGGAVRSTRLEQQAGLTIQAGSAAQTAGFLRGGSLLVTGAGKLFNDLKKTE